MLVPNFDWNEEAIIDFIGHELLDMESSLLELFRSAECSIEAVDSDWGRTQLQLRIVVPARMFRQVRSNRESVESAFLMLATPAFAGFDDVALQSVVISPKIAADPSWRGGVEQPIVVTEKQEDRIWKHPGLLRLFLSHKSDQKVALAAVKTQLLRYGIESFLAHEEITPTKAWAKVIQQGLQTCDALLAVGTAGLHSSSWCMQEVGWALGRGVLVLPVLAGEPPSGLHAELQGPTVTLSNASDSAKKIALALCEDDRMKPRIFAGISRRLQDATSGSATWAIWQAFDDLAPCPDSHVDDIIKAMEGNPEALKSTHAVPRFREWEKQVRPPGRNMPAFASSATPAPADEYDPFADE